MITMQPQNITGALFSTVDLMCLAEGSPQPEIHWYKDGAKMTLNSNTPSRLVIEELRPENRGFYHCQAKNSVGTVKSRTALVNIRGVHDIH